MGVYVPNIKKPKHCTECYFVCRDQCELQDNSYDYDTFKEQKKHCPLIEIDDTVWENEKYKLIRMTQAVRINKAMAERRADERLHL